ncbi:MAG TPA: TlpA disulfide reductase family protein [Bryobacteraceae bacterium]|jgi:peroxiredoxin|nr:TlpA disulfide reductase family protein [Bryobacteraceae bacterium]
MAAQKQHRLIETGSRAPDFRLPRLAGGEAVLTDLISDGPVLLAFFKVTCPVCQLTFPFLERLHSAGTLPIYGISQDDPEDTREFNRQFGVTLPMLLDDEEGGFPVSNAFGISSVPTMFLIERDGTISRVIEGWRKKEIEWLGSKAGAVPFRRGENVPEWKAG